MPGVVRLSIDQLIKEATELHAMGVPAVILFPVVSEAKKDPRGSESLNPDCVVYRAIEALKNALPDLCVIGDIALDPYTSHGQDGLVDEQGEVLNDPTLEVLSQSALLMAKSGADMVAPSDMMDGRVAHIRKTLDEAGYSQVNIMAYTAKYASSFYSPFRDALDSAPRGGHKRTYQMDPANVREALLECLLDEEEGADIIMIKPATLYLDIITRLREQTTLPIAAFHVSGEYAMLMAAARNGWLDANKALYETILGIKRAGADLILTYACSQICHYLENSRSKITHF